MIKVLIAVVALQHILIMCMEMFLWEKRGPAIFKSFDKDLFPKTKAMAQNMGLYNGFLAGGLIMSLCVQDGHWSLFIASFFLICVVIAGLYASVTAEKSIFLKQSPIALLTLVLIIFT